MFEAKFKPGEAEIFRAFIYSIFILKNKGRQALFIYDKGKTGKSWIMNVLIRFIGHKYVASLNSKSLSDGHAAEQFATKRLITAPDFNITNTTEFQIIKNITGSDWISVNPKFKTSYQVQPNAKLIVTTNKYPVISDEPNQLSRIILLDRTTKSPYDDYFLSIYSKAEEILFKEFGTYLNVCKESYEKLCPHNGIINIKPDLCKVTITVPQSAFKIKLFKKYLKLDRNGHLTIQELNSALEHCLNSIIGVELRLYEAGVVFKDYIAQNQEELKVSEISDPLTDETIYVGIKLNPRYKISNNKLIFIGSDEPVSQNKTYVPDESNID